MSRGLATPLFDEVTSESLSPILFVEIDWPSGVVYINSAVGTITWGGNDWLGVGSFGFVSQLDETSELRTKTMVYTLTGVPNSLISLALNDYYQGRPVKLYFGCIDKNTGQLVSTPILIDEGLMDVTDIEEGDTCSVTVTSVNRVANWERPRVRRLTDQDQQARFAGDTGLRFVSQAASRDVNWGRKEPDAS